jgi:sialate O-acetylesterase
VEVVIMKLFFVCIAVFTTCLFSARAELTLYPLFTDNAVLQRDIRLPVFGTAEGGKVTVSLAGKTLVATAKDGEWRVVFEPLKAGGPYTLTVKGQSTLTVKNILIGDVWICTGQSNMASGLAGYVQRYPEVLKGHPGDYTNDNIRLMKFKIEAADAPQKTPTLGTNFQTWKSCTPQSALAFSATGYFFGRNLQQHVEVPIGLLQTCMGGTPAESWTPKEVLEGNPKYKDIMDRWAKACREYPALKAQYPKRLEAWKTTNIPEGKTLKDLPAKVRLKMPRPPRGPGDVKRPSGLYNAMIASIHAFPIKGAIWYQGEGNAHSNERADQYRYLLPDMIKSWRQNWGVGDFPFYWVQLAPFRLISPEPQDTPWARMREVMDKIQTTVPNGGMACIIDGGSQKDIHPPYKEFAGARLALLARRNTYGQDVLASGPTLTSAKVAGSKMVLTFDNVGDGLMKKALSLDNDTVKVSGETLEGFTVSGKEAAFVNAQARITGKATVEVWADGLDSPTAVRYAWADFPLANLYNSENLPTGPFRTDVD